MCVTFLLATILQIEMFAFFAVRMIIVTVQF